MTVVATIWTAPMTGESASSSASSCSRCVGVRCPSAHTPLVNTRLLCPVSREVAREGGTSLTALLRAACPPPGDDVIPHKDRWRVRKRITLSALNGVLISDKRSVSAWKVDTAASFGVTSATAEDSEFPTQTVYSRTAGRTVILVRLVPAIVVRWGVAARALLPTDVFSTLCPLRGYSREESTTIDHLRILYARERVRSGCGLTG